MAVMIWYYAQNFCISARCSAGIVPIHTDYARCVSVFWHPLQSVMCGLSLLPLGMHPRRHDSMSGAAVL